MRLRVLSSLVRHAVHAALGAVLIHLAMAAAAAASAAPIKILALGDSLTAGYGLPAQDGFVAQLGRALKKAGIDAEIIDGGVSGDTAAGGLARLDWALGDDPKVVIVELGINDALRGHDPAATESSLDAIVRRLKQQGCVVLLAGMLAPPNLGSDYGASFNAIYGDIAKRQGVALYPFFLDGVAANPDLNQADGLHPTAAGVAIIVKRILPDVLKVIRQAQGQG